MENSQDSAMDRISNLPEELIIRILAYMPIQDAARTSVLSTSWRHSWRHIPSLDFSDFPAGNQSTNAVLRIIGQIIATHRRPILKFSLHLEEPFSYSEIHPVINSALHSGVQEFTLVPSEYQRHTLPMMFYSHLILTFLSLCNCHFEPPPSFIGFPRLTSLLLSNVFITSDVLTTLISNCPLIVTLDIESQYLVGSVSLIAPKLKFLTFRSPLKSISLVSAPCLKKVVLNVGLPLYLRFFEEQSSPELIGFDYPMLAIENLELDHFYLQGLATANAFNQAAFIGLKSIHLTGLLFESSDALPTLALARNCPNLVELTITIFFVWELDNIQGVQQLNEEYWSSDFTFSNLKEIKIDTLSGNLLEMEFVKFVLARSPNLETMTLIPSSRSYTQRVRHIQRELGKYFQLSLYANIILERPALLVEDNPFYFQDFDGLF